MLSKLQVTIGGGSGLFMFVLPTLALKNTL